MMRKLMVLLCTLGAYTLSFAQEGNATAFKALYLEACTDSNSCTEEIFDTLFERGELNEAVVYKVYAKHFDYPDLSEEVKELLLCYVKEIEQNTGELYYQKEMNNLVEDASAVYVEGWKAFSEGKNYNDSYIALFINQEFERLEAKGIKPMF